MIRPTIKITNQTYIVEGNTIYNPTEKVYYRVNAYVYNMTYKTEILYLSPIPPFGTSKNDFSIPIDSAVELGYELIR